MDPRSEAVNFTLWRNGQLLGRVRISFPVANSDAGIAGMLEVDEAFTDIDKLMQSSPLGVLGSPTFTPLLRDAHHRPGPVALRALRFEPGRRVETPTSLLRTSGGVWPDSALGMALGTL